MQGKLVSLAVSIKKLNYLKSTVYNALNSLSLPSAFCTPQLGIGQGIHFQNGKTSDTNILENFPLT